MSGVFAPDGGQARRSTTENTPSQTTHVALPLGDASHAPVHAQQCGQRSACTASSSLRRSRTSTAGDGKSSAIRRIHRIAFR